MSEHTKGPWGIEEDDDFGFAIIDPKNHYNEIGFCSVYMDRVDKPRDVAKANANLIAAAPDLLEALENCYKVLKMGEIDTALSLQCRLAIAKAKGE